jgi:hypothetical protein
MAEVVCLGSLELKHCLYWISASNLVDGVHSFTHSCWMFSLLAGICYLQQTEQKFYWQFY